MGCCLGGCLRLLLFALWRAIFAALVAMLFARVDAYVERRGWERNPAGRAWRAYRSTRKGGKSKGPGSGTGT